jgi:hypothetical protein
VLSRYPPPGVGSYASLWVLFVELVSIIMLITCAEAGEIWVDPVITIRQPVRASKNIVVRNKPVDIKLRENQ